MKTEQEIKEKKIEIQGELMNAVEAKNAYESVMGSKMDKFEALKYDIRIFLFESQIDVIDWMLL